MRRKPLRVTVLVTGTVALIASLTAGCTSGGTSAATAGGTSAATSSVAATPTAAGASATPAPTATRTSAAPATTVAAPSSGNIHQTVPSRVVVTRSAVPVRSTASFGDKVTVRATRIRAITATAHGPGEIGGPAVAVTLRFTNGTGRSISLGSTVVTVLDSAKDPASTIAGSPADPVSGRLAAGRSTTGTYVFTVPTNRRKPITINISYAPSAPVVLLTGNVA